MSSGQHLTKELYDLIKSIGETRSKQEEDKIIQGDLTALKSKINEKNTPPKKMKEYLIRAIYIEMLGHDASFAYIHAVNLSQNKTLSIKRMGYLACSLFFGPESELLVLLVATLQRDLMSKDVQEIMIALNTVSKLVSASIVSALVEPVSKLLTHASEAIRKKAVMALHKMYKTSPSSVSDFNEKMKKALCDRDPSVMGASLNVYYDLSRKDPKPYKELASSFVAILKQILENKLPRDYDYHRIPAPWIQIKLLQILAQLGQNDSKVSEQTYEIVAQTMKRSDDTGINIGYAITYQCVKTIASIYPNPSLLESAANSVSKFLNAPANTNVNNLKYLGINALISIVSINVKYALEHQLTVVDCLESKDETLKRETLDLLFKMTNGNNVDVIVAKLVHYLKNASDSHFRKDLVAKIIQISEQFAPNQEWYIKTMNTVLEHGSEFVDADSFTNILKLIDENFTMNQGFGEFLVSSYSEDLSKPDISDILTKIASWVLGEIGSRLYVGNPEKISELVHILARTLDNHHEELNTKSWILTAIAKLSVQNSSSETKETINQIFARQSRSKVLDIQQRSLEYRRFSGGFDKDRVDTSLSFLTGFVDSSVSRGGKTYDPSRNAKGLMKNMIDFGLVPESNRIKHEAYEPGQGKSQSKPRDPEKEDTGFKVTGKVKWGEQGFIEDKPETAGKIMGSMQAMSSANSNAISSNDPKLNANNNRYGSESSTGLSSSSNYPISTPTPVVKKPEDDPNYQKRMTEAKNLFGGLGGGFMGASTTPTTSNYSQPKPTTSYTTPANNYNASVQQPKPQPQQQTVDLLDFDDFGSTPTTTTTTAMPGYQPLNIDLVSYENHWSTIPGEIDSTIQTNVRTPNEFARALQKINFGLVQQAENEMICAGKTNSGDVILLYAVVNTDGKLDLKVKANTQTNMQGLVDALRAAC